MKIGVKIFDFQLFHRFVFKKKKNNIITLGEITLNSNLAYTFIM